MARLLSVHAHPDDEASKGAPTTAKAVAQGHEAFLVCATGGEEGDIINPAMKRPEIEADLPGVRAAELAQSVKIIGYHELVMLGYCDSGMADSEANANPECFAQADTEEAVERLVTIIRRFRPHVVMTYSDDQQGYRHPDHLQVHDISILAFERAGDPDLYPSAGEPWAPQKLYYSMWSRARMLAYDAAYKRLDIESPYDERWFERPSQDHRITTKVEIAEWHHVRSEALLAHATQVDPNEKFWFGLPEDVSASAYPFEDFILARSNVGMPADGEYEDDLFVGVSEVSLTSPTQNEVLRAGKA